MAMFSMFFGSGNIIFPVLTGQMTPDQFAPAITGLLLTAVLVPFLGLLALSLFDGDYLRFFSRLGRAPGWLIVLMIMGLIGPFAVIPRCIILSYGSLKTLSQDLNLTVFSAASCLLIFLCTFRQQRILDILGLALTPILLLSLATIIWQGLLVPADSSSSDYTSWEALLFGLSEGYNTMDLFASFMFSSVVLSGIRKSSPSITSKPAELSKVYLKASFTGMGLLAAIYTGMCYVAGRHSNGLQGVSADQLLSHLTMKILGPYAGIVVCLAVSLACLTTAISLAQVFTEFVSRDVLKEKVSYPHALIGTLVISFCMSTLEFAGIQGILAPILKLTLPALMVLTGLNLLHRFSGFRSVKIPVFITLCLTLLWRVFNP
ncbi:MAG: branched-chain amino acid transport system II carrier protein [Deltaproteobacteria bacterium]|nr:branched-chain amino acid transport system II carrier protein [Deltaproteobacteria bacterium]